MSKVEIKITKDIAQEVGLKKLAPFGVNKDSWTWKNDTLLDLARMDKKKIADLQMLLSTNADVRGVSVLLRDIETWKAAIALGAGKQKARTCRHFEPLLTKFIQEIKSHHLYGKIDGMADVYVAYYVAKTHYFPPQTNPPRQSYVSIQLSWEEFGGKKDKSVIFHEEDCRSMTVIEALARKNLYAETSQLRAKYVAQVTRFAEIAPQIGKQYLATGTAVDDLDGNPSGRDDSWYWRVTHTIQMERDDYPTRVVIDVFYEDIKSDRDRDDDRVDLCTWFWHNLEKRKPDEDEDESEAVDGSEEIPELEIPIHPLAAVFDLSKHLRLRIHVDYLTEYVYEKHMDEKLILPDDVKSFVKILVEYKSATFHDVIKGKSGGAPVLLTGPPGTGKTLTAEIFAEHEQRALYSIQCSQLGTDPAELEDELLKVFARSRRWNAVMLLDEADVYVRERGSDLQQNAIVGVFLRVLEYQSSVLFLTTNRPDDVDDAIASRCIARIDFKTPTVEDQTKIWQMLAECSKINLSVKTISEIVAKSKGITGRDVKNLLKLAHSVSAANGKPITASMVEFVKRFKPTHDKSA